MTPTTHGDRRSDRVLARRVLDAHDLTVRRLARVATSYNTVFRVTADEGTFALRVGAPLAVHPPGAVAAEAAWLDRLRAAGLPVAAVRPDRAGRPGTEVDDGVGPRTCALLDWVPGRPMRARVTAPAVAALGRLAARLHAEAERDALPGPPDVPVADSVLYWRLPDPLGDPDLPHGALFHEALHRAAVAVGALWRDPPGRPHLLHGDLAPANVVVPPGGPVPIDFQDLVWGHEVQDLSITVSALRRLAAGPRLEAAFRAGYAERRPWPDVPPSLFEDLVAARALHQVALTVALYEPAELGDYLDVRAERLAAWLRT